MKAPKKLKNKSKHAQNSTLAPSHILNEFQIHQDQGI